MVEEESSILVLVMGWAAAAGGGGWVGVTETMMQKEALLERSVYLEENGGKKVSVVVCTGL